MLMCSDEYKVLAKSMELQKSIPKHRTITMIEYQAIYEQMFFYHSIQNASIYWRLEIKMIYIDDQCRGPGIKEKDHLTELGN